MIKKTLFIFALLLLPLVSYAQTNPGIADIINLTATPENPVVGKTTRYTIAFDITTQAHTELKNGTLLITFPEGFDISSVGVDGFNDFSDDQVYEVLRSTSSGSSISLQVRDAKFDKVKTTIVEDTPEGYVSMSLTISNIVNISEAGFYQISLMALKKNNTVLYGPGLSAPFEIVPGLLSRIEVTSSDPLNLTAGDILNLHARGYDEYDNFIDDIAYSWSLVDCETDCIGELTDSTLLATTVGAGMVMATAQGITGYSGLITVEAGELSRINLNLSSDQFVGIPLVGEATITLTDNYGNLKDNYDLAANPISLNLAEGQLEPSLLDDNSYNNNGIIDLNAVGVTYNGNSITTDISATNGALSSELHEIAFNRYDHLSILNNNSEPLSAIFVDLSTSLKIPFVNLGSVPADEELEMNVSINGIFREQYFITPPLSGVSDTFAVTLGTLVTVPGTATISVELVSKFNSPDGIKTLSASAEVEVEVLATPRLLLVEDSFAPDTLIAGRNFEYNFSYTSPVAIPAPDSVVTQLYLLDQNGAPKGEIFNEVVSYNYRDSKTVNIGNLIASIDPLFLIEGENNYQIDVITHHYTHDVTYILDELVPVYIYPSTGLTYLSGTLTPKVLYAGSDVTFSFDLDNSFSGQVTVLPDGSQFRLKDGDYIASANLTTNGLLEIGTNSFESNRMFIPLDLIGKKLTATAEFKYQLTGISDTLTYTTDFAPDTIQIDVASQPMVRIIALDIIAPNQPRVNVNQQFQLRCDVANLSEETVSDLELGLYTTGPFNLGDSKKVTINAGDTAEVFFDVSAYEATTISDFIRVEILSQGLTILPAVDDIAIIAVETPADLMLSYRLLGVSGNIVDVDNTFDIDISLDNMGQAQATGSDYMLIIEGLDANGPDTITGYLEVDDHFDYSATAPSFDTTINISFQLTGTPIDNNTNLPAMIDQTEFSLNIDVVSISTEVLVETQLLGSNLLLPGRQQDILKFIIRNNSPNTETVIELERFNMEIFDSEHQLGDVRDIINLSNTGIYSNGLKVTTPVAGDNLLSLLFDNFMVYPQQEVELILKIELKEFSSSTISLKASEEDLVARYAAGPNAGEIVPVSSTNPGEPILNSAFVLKGLALDKSFLIEKNPVNPKEEDVHFSYELPQDAGVEFKIFTLTGEVVFERHFSAGSSGGAAGENDLYWDGRNDDGHIVINGVYIAYIKNTLTDETAKIKVAILK